MNVPATSLTSENAKIDFDAAEVFLRLARDAHAAGDMEKCFAARKLVGVALNLSPSPNGKLHTAHLQDN